MPRYCACREFSSLVSEVCAKAASIIKLGDSINAKLSHKFYLENFFYSKTNNATTDKLACVLFVGMCMFVCSIAFQSDCFKVHCRTILTLLKQQNTWSMI